MTDKFDDENEDDEYEDEEQELEPPPLPRFRVARKEDIPIQRACILRCREVTVALFRTHDGHLFALEDRCPHQGGPLSEGIVHGHRVTCPLHNWVIDLPTGEAQAPDRGSVRTFAVEVVDDEVVITLPSEPLGIIAPQVAPTA